MHKGFTYLFFHIVNLYKLICRSYFLYHGQLVYKYFIDHFNMYNLVHYGLLFMRGSVMCLPYYILS